MAAPTAKKPETETKERRRNTTSQTDERSICLPPYKSVLDQSVTASLALTQDKLVDGILDYTTSAEIYFDVVLVPVLTLNIKNSCMQGKGSGTMLPKKSKSETKERRRRTFNLTSPVSTSDTLGDDSPDHKTSAEFEVKQSTKITALEASEVLMTNTADNKRRTRSDKIEEEDRRLKMGARYINDEVERRNICSGVTDTSVTHRQATDSRGKMESLKFQLEREMSHTPRSQGPLWTRWRTSTPSFKGDSRREVQSWDKYTSLGTCSRRRTSLSDFSPTSLWDIAGTSIPKQVFNFAWRQKRLNLGCAGRSGHASSAWA